MATAQQVYSALRIHNVFNVLNTSSPINFSLFDDITDWGGMNISTANGDTVKLLAQVVAPTGITCYENTGYVADDYASPDTTLLDLVSPTWNLPVYTGGNTYVNGLYTMNVKVQVERGVNTISGVFGTSQLPSALPNNILSKSAPTSPPYSSIKFTVLGNLATALMNKGDVYELDVNGDVITYTVPSSTQTVQQFYYDLYQTILVYQMNNPSSDWNNVAGSFGSNSTQYWLNLNRTDSASIFVGVSYTPFGTPQRSEIQYSTTPLNSLPTVDTVVGFTVYGETISYTVVSGDTLNSMVANIYASAQTYITNNPSSNIAQYLDVTYSGAYIILESKTGNNSLFTATVNVSPPPTQLFIVEKTFSFDLPKNVTPNFELTETWNCSIATYTSTDTTVYCTSGCASGYSVTNIVKTHTVYPPAVSGQSNVTASSTTIVLGAPDNQLWTGTYEAKLSAVVTLTQGDSTVITHGSVTKEAKVICDDLLCGLYCQMQKLYASFMGYLGHNTTEANKYKGYLEKGLICYQLATQARLCSKESMVEQYVADFYKLTGTDPNCNCCTDESSPVIPTTIVNGTDGTDGETPEFRVTGTIFQYKYPSDTVWTTIIDLASLAGADGKSFLQGSGVPSNGDGNNDDTYLDIDTYDIYLKSAGSWSVTGNIKGDDGVGLLVNEYTQVATTTTGAPEVLKSYTVAGGTFASNGDMLEVEAVYTRILTNSTASAGSIIVGGEAETVFANFGTNISGSKVNVKLTRISSTALEMERTITSLVGTEVVGQTISFPVLSMVYDFTSDIDIELSAQDATAGTTAVNEFRITKFKI